MATVTLLSHTPDPDRLIASAAKLCYSNSDIETLMDGLTQEKSEKFLHMLLELGHESPLEHVSFTFGIEGVSRSLLAQITRHRIASFSVQSQRYVREKAFAFVTPPEIAADETAKALYEKSMEQAVEAYDALTEILKAKHTKTLLDQGLSEKDAASKAEKMAIEDARFVLPNACETKMVMTMNVRSLYNFFHHRCCNRAQWEIRAVAKQMAALCYEVSPTLFALAGPPCLSGRCPEGKMSCGKMKEMQAEYAAMREEIDRER